MTKDFQFPTVHITRTFTGEDGERYKEGLTPPVCDFCMDVRVRWDYDCERFVLPNGFASVEGFASCDLCSVLVEAEDWDGLTARVFDSWIALNLPDLSPADAKEIVAGFREHYTPGRKAFG